MIYIAASDFRIDTFSLTMSPYTILPFLTSPSGTSIDMCAAITLQLIVVNTCAPSLTSIVFTVKTLNGAVTDTNLTTLLNNQVSSKPIGTAISFSAAEGDTLVGWNSLIPMKRHRSFFKRL